MSYVKFVLIVLIDTAAKDEGEGRVSVIPRPTSTHPSNYDWSSKGGILVTVSFVLLSVLINFKMFECFNFNASACPIYLIQ